MTRRSLFNSAALAPFAGAPAETGTAQSLIEITTFRLRNGGDKQRSRAVDFLKEYLPAFRRAGGGPAGAFSSNLGEGTPYLVLIRSYPGFAAMEAAAAKLGKDQEMLKAMESWYAGGLPYVRVENSLFRAFPSMPNVEPPPLEGRKANRLFELRTYESDNLATLARKVDMFGSGEMAIFRRLSIVPVFFGTSMFAPNVPNLTYMVAHEDMAAREKNWGAFSRDPEWEKLRSKPEYSDPGLVSNISAALLSPLPFSEIR
jgi:hypothetical protein